jgi:hypothetical protein
MFDSQTRMVIPSGATGNVAPRNPNGAKLPVFRGRTKAKRGWRATGRHVA